MQNTNLATFHPYCQKGSRHIIIPFDFSSLPIKPTKIVLQELGNSENATIQHQDKIAVTLLPGEGKILRLTFLTTSQNPEQEKSTDITIAPNPANEEFTISYPAQNAVLTIAELTGNIIINEPFTNSHTLSVKELPIGMYIVKITTSQKTVYGKVMIHH
jgi:hypothetical protein